MSARVVTDVRKKAGQASPGLRTLVQRPRTTSTARVHQVPSSAGHGEGHLGHDLGRQDIRPSPGVQQQSTGQPKDQICPLPVGPRACPFGGACHTCPPSVQAKLTIGQPGDAYEQEADRVAERVMRAPAGEILAPSVLMNDVDAGKVMPARERPGRIPSDVPPVVQEVLGSPGQPLDAATRAFMEPRFGHDFSHVRVHTDRQAAESARALSALAYSVGDHLAFSSGRYSPHSRDGMELLAHELTHVAQRRNRSSLGGTAQDDHGLRNSRGLETGPRAGGQAKSGPNSPTTPAPAPPELLLRRIHGDFGGRATGDRFSETELQDYLRFLDRGQIEDHSDSDNKARAIVNQWRQGGSPYVLTAQRKRLLIAEMQSGFTGDEDETAILEILERSYNGELSTIIGSSGVTASSLNGDFQGEEQDELSAFFERRFEGGEAALLEGRVQPRGLPVPLGYDLAAATELSAAGRVLNPEREFLLGSTAWDVPCVLGILCSQDRSVVEALRHLTVKRVSDITVDRWSFTGGAWHSEIARPAGLDNRDEGLIVVRGNRDCDDAAATFVHEARHQGQLPNTLRYDREVDAYTYTEQWTIERGLPGHPNLRTTQPSTGLTPSSSAIETYVAERYGRPGSTSQEVVTGHRDPDTSILTTGERPSQEGDVYIDDSTLQLVAEDPIPTSQWRCPGTT